MADVLEAALAASRAGELERCVEVCASAAEASLSPPVLRLYVDALRVLGRTDEALFVAQRAQCELGEPGYSLARSALGLAQMASGALNDSESTLREALRAAEDDDQREDAANLLALAYFMEERFDEALASVRTVERPLTALRARRLELEAAVAFHRNDVRHASSLLWNAIDILDRVPHEFRLELNILAMLGDHVVETLDIDAWPSLANRISVLPPIPASLWWARCALANQRSLIAEIVGQPDVALSEANRNVADDLPPFPRLMGMCRKAAILFRYDEPLAYRDLADMVWRAYQRMDLGMTSHPIRGMMYPVVVETLVRAGNVRAAERVIADAESWIPPQTPWRHSAVMDGQYNYMYGLVADARGETLHALHRYRAAWRTLRRIGLHRQGIIVAQYLAEIDPSEQVLRYIDGFARRLGPQSWLRLRFARVLERRRVEIAKLTRSEREVLAHLLAGRRTAEIAALRKRSVRTIRNTISSLLKIFGVDNRQALVCECLRRGMAPEFPGGLPSVRTSGITSSGDYEDSLDEDVD